MFPGLFGGWHTVARVGPPFPYSVHTALPGSTPLIIFYLSIDTVSQVSHEPETPYLAGGLGWHTCVRPPEPPLCHLDA